MTAFFVPPAPAEDDALDNVLHDLIAGVTGLDGSLVRPMWQFTLAQQLEQTGNWCAFGVMSSVPDANPVVEHLFGDDITAPAGDRVIRHEELEVLVSFYGPGAKSNVGLLRDGLAVEQNRYAARAAGLYFVDMEPARNAPDFINQQWIRRWDTSLRFRRMVARVYGVNNIVAAEIDLLDDTGHVDRKIQVPPDGRS